jgi:hypothetical protein
LRLQDSPKWAMAIGRLFNLCSFVAPKILNSFIRTGKCVSEAS